MNAFKKLIIEAFHPKLCAACETIIDGNQPLCDYCFEMLVRCDPLKRCITCGLNKDDCRCESRVYCFDGCVSPFVNVGVAQRAMYRFKFGRKISAADFFAEQMAFCVKNEYRDLTFDAVCFVPMLKRQQLRRGFNQSRVLAEKISDILGIPIIGALKCVRSTPSQHMLKANERFGNVKGKYAVSCRVAGKTLLLVDDIMTTGATLDECARQLLLAGAANVYCVTALVGVGKSALKKQTKPSNR